MPEQGNVNTQTEDDVSPVAVPGTGYVQMSSAWELILDLLGGTLTMRGAATKWLPQEASESKAGYESRLSRSILFNGFKDTLGKLKNRPFRVPVIVKELPEGLAYLEEDVDGIGTSLSDFVKGIIENLIEFGVAHIYVDHSDMTPVEDEESKTINITKAEEEAAGARVFFWNVSPIDLIGWQTEVLNNITNLTQIRIQETAVIANGDYGDVEVNYINVFNNGTWEKHKQDDDKPEKYDLIETGVTTIGKIPLVTIYADKTGFLTAKPPLEDLAWLNLAHWQSYSDQRNILKFSRYCMLFGKGFPKKQVASGSIVTGPTRAVLTESTEADLKYVEPTGKGLDAGLKDVEDIEQKMRVLGNQPMVKNVPVTATTDRIDESRTVSQLQAWVVSTERGVLQALKLAAEWRKIELSDNTTVDIFHDFEATVLGGGDKDLLHKMRQSGDITGELLIREEQRRGVFSEDVDPEEEAKAARDEDIDSLRDFVPGTDDDDNDDDDNNLVEE